MNDDKDKMLPRKLPSIYKAIIPIYLSLKEPLINEAHKRLFVVMCM